MNVLLVGYLHGRGGIQTHTHNLATGLAEQGDRVTVVTPPAIAGQSGELPSTPVYELIGYSGLKDARGRRRPFDVAVVTGTGWRAMAEVLALPRGCRKIFFEVMSGKRARGPDPRMLVHGGFDAIVGQGAPVEARFRREFLWRGKSAAIPALPDPLERSCSIPRRRSLRPQRGEGLKAAVFGRLARHKNIDLLIERWSDLAGLIESVDVYGGGPHEEALRSKISDAGLERTIRLMGPYPSGADYVELLQRYQLKLLPTVGEEGAPLVLLEAMACGLPFAANGMGGIPDYRNQDCEITSGDIAEFIPSVRRLAERIVAGDVDPARLQQHYADNFSFAALTRRWRSFLQEICAPESAGERIVQPEPWPSPARAGAPDVRQPAVTD